MCACIRPAALLDADGGSDVTLREAMTKDRELALDGDSDFLFVLIWSIRKRYGEQKHRHARERVRHCRPPYGRDQVRGCATACNYTARRARESGEVKICGTGFKIFRQASRHSLVR
jgi:hypothetical protein